MNQHPQPARAPSPAGYVRQDALAQLGDVFAHSIGIVVFKKPAPGRVALHLQPFAPWASVAERLPDDEALVLIALNDDDVWTGYRNAGTWCYPDRTPIDAERVTHWMPLPPLPGAAA